MTVFRDLEKRLEKVFEGFFIKNFQSALQPIELAKKLAVEMDRKKHLSIERVYAPNVFNVILSEQDHEQFEGLAQSLTAELADYLNAYARSRNYFLAGPIRIVFSAKTNLATGECEILSQIDETKTAAVGDTQIISAEEARLMLAGERSANAFLENMSTREKFALSDRATSIGRQKKNDIVLDLPSISRTHAQITKTDRGFFLEDLDSTNGTFVNGVEIDGAAIYDGDIIAFGNYELVFRSRDD